MIYICSGLPKSATTICYKYIESALEFQKDRNKTLGYIHKFGFLNSAKILVHIVLNNNVLLKTHTAPNQIISLLIKLKLAKVIYSIRDPRDIILSSIDFKPESNKQKIFKNLTSIENTIYLVDEKISDYYKWKKVTSVLFIRYEDITSTPHEILKEICTHFDFNTSEEKINKIIKKYEAKPISNFNTGKSFRYKLEMTAKEIDFCNSIFKNKITDLGYSF